MPIEDLMNVSDPVDEYGEPMTDNPEAAEPTPVLDEPQHEESDDDFESIEFDNEEEEAPVEEEPEQPVEDKPVQTPEENAFYAEQRRQRQEAERQAEIDRQIQERLQQTPEYQVTQLLAKQYGISPQEMQAQLQQVQLQKEAEQRGVPVEVLQQIQQSQLRQQELESKLTRMEFESWYSSQQAEAAKLTAKYEGVLTDTDINDALSYMLNDLKSTTVPLDRVIRMVHGEKIENHLLNMAKQEALAEISGRKQNPLVPQGGKPAQTEVLSAEEQHVAKMMGLTEAEYLKYR